MQINDDKSAIDWEWRDGMYKALCSKIEKEGLKPPPPFFKFWERDAKLLDDVYNYRDIPLKKIKALGQIMQLWRLV